MSGNPGEDAAFEAYASAIEDYFLRRRGSARLTSPRDWMLLRDWFAAEVPLPIVLAGLAEVFDRFVATGRAEPVSSIAYCRHAVAKRWKDHQLALAGAAPKSKKKVDTRSLAERFREAATRLEATAPRVATEIAGVVPDIERLAADETIAASDREQRLFELECGLVDRVFAAAEAEERASLEEEARAPLTGLAGAIAPEERTRLVALGRLRAVRHRYALPRFTLLPR